MKDKLQIPRYPDQDSIGAGTDTSHMEYWGDKGAIVCGWYAVNKCHNYGLKTNTCVSCRKAKV